MATTGVGRGSEDAPVIDRTEDFRTAGSTAHPSDVESPEAVVRALYESISGPRDVERDWDRLRSLFGPGARLLIGRWLDRPDEARDAVVEWDLDAFVSEGREFWLEDGFWERELRSRVERYGNIAHVLSSYESRVGSPDDAPVGRGVNSVQLLRHDGRWWIVGILWDVEGPDNPIPKGLEGS